MKRISYSQYNQWITCPHKWKLNYIDDLGEYTDSIHTLFGTSMHEVLQTYLTVMYNGTVKEADSIDLHKYLKDQMFRLYKEAVEKMGEHFSNKFELGEFYEDGVAIRAGHHCCQIFHDKLGVPATARASLGIYNTKEDLDKLNEAINKCKKIFNTK